MNDVTNDAKRAILENKLALWKNTQFDALVDIELAKKIGDQGMEKAAFERARQCEVVIKTVAEMMEALK